MQVTSSDAGTLRKQLTITWTAAEVAAKRADLLKRLSGQVKLDGFRAGKVPRALVERRYGAAADQQAEEDLCEEGLRKAIEQEKLQPVGPVNQEGLERGQGLRLKVAFEIRPVFTLPEVGALSVKSEPVEVTEAEIDEVIDGIARRTGETGDLAAGETLVEDDAVTLSGTISVGGAEVRKLHEFHHLVGGYPLFGKPVAEVIELAKGKKVGDVLDFATVLPASYPEHAGKEARIAVTVTSAKRTRPAAKDDALAQRIGQKDLASLRETVKTGTKARKENAQRQRQLEEVAEQLMGKVEMALPPLLLAELSKSAGAEAETRAAGKPADEIAKAKAEAEAGAARWLKRSLVVDALAAKLGVEVTQQDFTDQIMMAAQQTGRKPEDLARQLSKSGRINQVASEIREAKALETLLDQVLGKPAAAAAPA